jgi:hypothetical protein
MGMVRYHYAERKDAPSTAQTGTRTYNLPKSGFIPEILLQAYSTPTASSAQALQIFDAITKIQIRDGAKIIKDFDMEHAASLAMYHGSREFHCTHQHQNGTEGYEGVRIFLGQKVNGRMYAPDMSRFSNPQLVISWDHSTTTSKHGVTQTADTAPVTKFTLLCKVAEGGGKYTHGYVKTYSLKTWTQAASTETHVEIPTEGKLLGLLVEGGYDAKNFTDEVNELKLDFNTGDWVPLNLYAEEVIKFQQLVYPESFEVTFTLDIANGEELDTHMGWVGKVSLGPIEETNPFQATWTVGSKGVETINFYNSGGGAIGTPELVQVHAQGWLPFHGFYIPMSALTDGDSDFIDTGTYKNIDLYLTSGSSASTSSTPEVLAEYLITS